MLETSQTNFSEDYVTYLRCTIVTTVCIIPNYNENMKSYFAIVEFIHVGVCKIKTKPYFSLSSKPKVK